MTPPCTRAFYARRVGKRGLKRLPVTIFVAVCAVVIGAALSGVAVPVPGLELAHAGHWLASPSLNLVLFVNGSAKSIDAQVPVAGLEPGTQVVQGETSGYVIGKSDIVEFGKSDLSVVQSVPAPSGERPALVEASGGPYLVYREAGRVVRLGGGFASMPAGGRLGDPVATPDGTLFLYRPDEGLLCRLPKSADTITCSDHLPAGHAGALSVVGDRAVFLDTTAGALRQVSGDKPGEPVKMGVDLTAAAKVSPADADGRIAVFEPGNRQLYFLDAAAAIAGREPGPPARATLPDGAYSTPTASASTVVLLDLAGKTVRTYAPDGTERQVTPIPPETGTPQLTRGDDKRVYVDGGEGKHVVIVDPDGAVSNLPVAGAKPPTAPQTKQPPPPPPPATTGRPEVGPPVPLPKPIPASPPGIPAQLAARVQGADAQVTWNAAAPNRAAVTGYHVAWQSSAGGGSADLPGTARSTTIASLATGVPYTITVTANNSAGRGAPATARVTRPAPPPPSTPPPPAVTITVSRGTTGTYDDSCRAPDCAKMHVVATGLTPGKSYDFVPHSKPPYSNEGAGRRADSAGRVDFEAFDFAQIGNTVWITVDQLPGVQSNRYVWPGD